MGKRVVVLHCLGYSHVLYRDLWFSKYVLSPSKLCNKNFETSCRIHILLTKGMIQYLYVPLILNWIDKTFANLTVINKIINISLKFKIKIPFLIIIIFKLSNVFYKLTFKILISNEKIY